MKILYLHANPDQSEFYNDYLSDLLLHGLRENYGKEVIDYPGNWHLYNDEVQKRGKNFTFLTIVYNILCIDLTGSMVISLGLHLSNL